MKIEDFTVTTDRENGIIHMSIAVDAFAPEVFKGTYQTTESSTNDLALIAQFLQEVQTAILHFHLTGERPVDGQVSDADIEPYQFCGYRGRRILLTV